MIGIDDDVAVGVVVSTVRATTELTVVTLALVDSPIALVTLAAATAIATATATNPVRAVPSNTHGIILSLLGQCCLCLPWIYGTTIIATRRNSWCLTSLAVVQYFVFAVFTVGCFWFGRLPSFFVIAFQIASQRTPNQYHNLTDLK